MKVLVNIEESGFSAGIATGCLLGRASGKIRLSFHPASYPIAIEGKAARA
jgi:hypothetical protein